MRIALAAAVAVSVPALLGCGEMQQAELSRGVGTLGALAAEAQLVADGVARDRTKSTYARVHARTLAEDAAHEAEKLADASVEPGIEGAQSRAVELAQQLDDTIGQLETFPGNERTGARTRDQLKRISDEVNKLLERLETGL